MTRKWNAAIAILAALAAGAAPALSQQAPKRPKLTGALADTNDATAYLLYGTFKLDSDPWEAADALYWATRIDPTSAAAYYVRWIALEVQDPGHLDHLSRSNSAADRHELLAIDSLNMRALMLNPFLWRYLERKRLELLAIRSEHGSARARIQAFASLLGRFGPYNEATNAYSAGAFPLALKQYATVIALADSVRRTSAKDAHAGEKNAALDRFSAQMHLQRARVFFTSTLYDSAAVELRLAEVGFHASESEEEHIIPIYESRALLEYALGITEEQLGRADSAREAFARALQEDLSFVPAHFSMARLSLAAHDTASAIQGMQLGGKLDPNDPATAFFEGRALLMAGRVPLAVAPFNRSIALDPYFATPHYYLAAIYEGSGYNDEAVEEYQKYLSLAASSDTLLKSAQKRLSALRVAAPITPPPEP